MTTVTKQVHFAFQQRRKVVKSGLAPDKPGAEGRTPRVSKLMALAIRFDRLLTEGIVGDLSELARLTHVTQPRITQVMNLLHLAPDIQEEILHLSPVEVGNDSIHERMLRPVCAESDWRRQRELWHQLAPMQSAVLESKVS